MPTATPALVIDSRLSSGTGDAEGARLLIHAQDSGAGDGWRIDSLLQRLRAHVRDAHRARHRPLALDIVDLDGHRVLALDDACALVEVALPAGTYHVSASMDGSRRCYTVALKPGAVFDLHLRSARGRD